MCKSNEHAVNDGITRRYTSDNFWHSIYTLQTRLIDTNIRFPTEQFLPSGVWYNWSSVLTPSSVPVCLYDLLCSHPPHVATDTVIVRELFNWTWGKTRTELLMCVSLPYMAHTERVTRPTAFTPRHHLWLRTLRKYSIINILRGAVWTCQWRDYTLTTTWQQ